MLEGNNISGGEWVLGQEWHYQITLIKAVRDKKLIKKTKINANLAVTVGAAV
jgi:hypothetical protein